TRAALRRESRARAPAAQPATSSPGVAPSPTSSAAATGDGLHGAAWRRLLVEAAKNQDWKRGGEAVLALVDREPERFRDPQVVRRVIAVAAGLDTTGAAAGDEVFRALGTRLGADGLDVLFEIARTRKGSLERRAAGILCDQDVIPLESAALRIAFELSE